MVARRACSVKLAFGLYFSDGVSRAGPGGNYAFGEKAYGVVFDYFC